MSRSFRIRPVAVKLWFLPVETRVPLKFGTEVLRSVTCARVSMTVADDAGRTATGFGETPLNVQWVWPSSQPFAAREAALKGMCRALVEAFGRCAEVDHPLWVGSRFADGPLEDLRATFDTALPEPLPRLAGLVCFSAFDLAMHDAFGQLHKVDSCSTFGPAFLRDDLTRALVPARRSSVDFKNLRPGSFMRKQFADRLDAWHLVGGLDPLTEADLDGSEPDDGYPLLLSDWIRRDGLKCLKIKLRGNDLEWDLARLKAVGRIGIENRVEVLCADFNCTARSSDAVCEVLDRLAAEEPAVFQRLAYVEQPFGYDIEKERIDVHAIARRKPVLMDESAHDWRAVSLGQRLGYSGVALKTCKSFSGALLSASWAAAHGMSLMVQDLTNPMLAQIPHCRLASIFPTLRGVETNAMQFYPDASAPEAAVHPGLYRRHDGQVNLLSVGGAGFGYRIEKIDRPLGDPDCGWA